MFRLAIRNILRQKSRFDPSAGIGRNATTISETRVANRTFVDGALADAFAAHDYASLQLLLAAADLAFAPVNRVTDLKDHPDFHTRAVQVAGQTVALPLVPGREKTAGQVVPELGQHTDAVRRWLETRDN